MKNTHTLKLRWLATCAAVCMALPVQAQMVDAEEIYALDFGQQWNYGASLFSVDPDNGSRTMISDFGNTSQGQQGGQPTGMALLDSDTMLVLDNLGGPFGPALLSVDLNSGQRTMVSDFANWWEQGVSTFYVAGDVVPTGDGKVLVTTPFTGTNFSGSLLSIDLATGFRTQVTDFGNPSQGAAGRYPISVLQTNSGDTLVLTTAFGAGGALYSVDTSNGQRTLISDFTNPAQGILGSNPIDMVEIQTGDIYVVDGSYVLRVLANGSRQIISDLTNLLQGPTSGAPSGIAVDASGWLVLSETGLGQLLMVNPITGLRTVASDFNDPAQGPTGQSPVDTLLVH